MKIFIVSNNFVDKIYTWVLLKFLNSNFNWIFKIIILLIPSERLAFSKKLLNELATLDSAEIISSFSSKDIFGKVVTL